MKLQRSGGGSTAQPTAAVGHSVEPNAGYDKYRGLFSSLLRHIVAQKSVCSDATVPVGHDDTLAIAQRLDELSAILLRL